MFRRYESCTYSKGSQYETSMRQATYSELKDLLTSDPMKLVGIVGNPDAQLSIPLDERGPRVLVETQAGCSKEVPISVRVRIGGEDVNILMEARETAQKYVPQQRE